MRMTTPLPLLMMMVLALASCAKQSAKEEPAAGEPLPLQVPPMEAPAQASSPMSDLRPVPRQAGSVLINSGTLPLAHLFDQGGQVRIVNATTKQTLLTTGVDAGSIISVSDSGILVARQRRLTTRLDPRQRYEIWWDVGRGAAGAGP